MITFVEKENPEKYASPDQVERRRIQEELDCNNRTALLEARGATAMGAAPGRIVDGKRNRSKTVAFEFPDYNFSPRKKPMKTLMTKKSALQAEDTISNTIQVDEDQGQKPVATPRALRIYLDRYIPPVDVNITSYYNLGFPKEIRGEYNDRITSIPELSQYFRDNNMFWKQFNLEEYCRLCGNPFVYENVPCAICKSRRPRFSAASLVQRSVRYTGKIFTFILLKLYEVEFQDFNVSGSKEYETKYKRFNRGMNFNQRFVDIFYSKVGTFPPLTVPHPFISTHENMDCKTDNGIHLIAAYVLGVGYLDYKDTDEVRLIDKLQGLEWVSYREIFKNGFSMGVIREYIKKSGIVKSCKVLHWAHRHLGLKKYAHLGEVKRLFPKKFYKILFSTVHVELPKGELKEDPNKNFFIEEDDQSSDDDNDCCSITSG